VAGETSLTNTIKLKYNIENLLEFLLLLYGKRSVFPPKPLDMGIGALLADREASPTLYLGWMWVKIGTFMSFY